MRSRSDDALRTARFEALYRAQFGAIAAYVRRRVPAADAADVVARTFAVAWRRVDHVPPAPQDRLWLYGVARRTVSDHLRAGRRRARLQVRLSQHAWCAAPVAAGHASTGGALELVADAIDALARRDREVLQLLLWDDLTHSEAADVLGCSVNAVEIRFRRARRHVRAAMEARHGLSVEAPEPDHASVAPPMTAPRRAQP